MAGLAIAIAKHKMAKKRHKGEKNKESLLPNSVSLMLLKKPIYLKSPIARKTNISVVAQSPRITVGGETKSMGMMPAPMKILTAHNSRSNPVNRQAGNPG